MSLLPLVRIWIWISVLAAAAGWILSAMGQLNRVGYLVFFGVSIAVFLFGRRRLGWSPGRWSLNPKKLRRRFCRAWPLCFAVLSVLIFLGAVLYPPSNHTALSYRTPRVLHWLAEGRWHWIHTPDYRMNNRACGIEWLSAPLLLFLRSDRPIVLLNFIPFLLLPGLIFNVCTRLGVKGRVAWNWMWLLPTGYNFLLQAGSAGNDTFPTVYALAAIDFGCRAWSSRRLSDLWMSGLAAALLVGAKASNLPLLLPWGLLILPLLPLVKKRPIATIAIVVVAALVSFLPTAILNIIYVHDWSGLRLEHTGMDMKTPFVGVWGNVFLFLLENFVPPFFPLAGWWNQHALTVLPRAIVAPLVTNFENGFHILGELPTEDASGIGFGVSVLVGASLLGAPWYRRRVESKLGENDMPQIARAIPLWGRRCALLGPWIALLAYCIKSGMVTGARLISPYYPLLLPLILKACGSAGVVRSRWWRIIVWCNFLLAVPVLVLTPGRPLWPARTVLARLHFSHPGNHAFARALEVYSTYADRWDSLPKVRELLPPGLRVVGFMGTEDDIDISIWRPFGSRRVCHVLLADSAQEIRQRQIRYIVVGGFNLTQHGERLEEWLARTPGELVGTVTATQKVVEGPQPWYVVRLSGQEE